jgi:hypothetical protein
MGKSIVAAKTSISRWLTLPICAALLLVSGAIAPAFAGKAIYIGAAGAFDPNTGYGGPGIDEISAAQLKSGGVAAPIAISNVSTVLATSGVCFDKQKNLWATTLDVNLLEFTHKQLTQLSKSPDPTPANTLSSSSFGFILSCLFDKKGNLWVVDSMNDGIHEITKSQLASITGSTISTSVDLSDATDLASPAFATFDKSGNLWMSSQGNNSIVMFAKNQITSSNSSITGTVVISSPSLVGPGQLQFDKKGTLWVANSGFNNDSPVLPHGSIVGFTKDQLTASGNPTANIVISSATLSDGSQSLDVPWGVTFDTGGNMWVFNYTAGEFTDVNSSWLVKFAKKDLKVSGAPTPAVEVTGLPEYSGELAFGPPTK